MQVVNLKTNGIRNPLGINEIKPSFSWIIEATGYNRYQTAYQIIISENESLLKTGQGDIWDSGKVTCSNNTDVIYAGKELESGIRYYWSVRVWDEKDEASSRSEAGWFETALLKQEDWCASWIGAGYIEKSEGTQHKHCIIYKKSFTDLKGRPLPEAAPYLKKDFSTQNKVIKRARIYVTGLGYFRLSLNGEKVSEDLLTPMHTNYSKTVYYLTYDLTGLVKAGDNTLGMELGKGFYSVKQQIEGMWRESEWNSPEKMKLQMEIIYDDGSVQRVVSDDSWKMTFNTPLKFNSIFWGEVYDARSEIPGWNKPGFDDSDWSNADIVPAPKGKMKGQYIKPIKVINTEKPLDCRKLDNGDILYESLYQIAGNVRIRAKAPSGSVMQIKYGENINSDGSVTSIFLIEPEECQTDKYIFKGDRDGETYEPVFSYKGFKYIQISGDLEQIEILGVETLEIHNEIDEITSFETSNTLINKIREITVRTIKNNLHGKITDTPTYEKQGWLGDVNISLPVILSNFEIKPLLEKWVGDIEDAMSPLGLIPVNAPTGVRGLEEYQVVWDSAYIFTIWELYNYTGSTRMFTENYDSMKKYLDFEIEGIVRRNYKADNNRLADWCTPEVLQPEGSEIVSTIYTYMMLETAAKIAEMSGHTEDAERFLDVSGKIRSKFNEYFYKEQEGIYDTIEWTNKDVKRHYRQSSNIMPLITGAVPEGEKCRVLGNLVKDIMSRNYHINTGIIGSRYIYPALSENGFGELAYKLSNQTTMPSIGFMIENGTTTLWESWEPYARSRDHFFFGTVTGWFYEYLAGVRDVKNGYESFTVRPELYGDLKYVDLSVSTVRGRVSVSASKEDGKMTLHAVIPVGSTVRICLPGEIIQSSAGNGSKEGQDNVFTVGSGEYYFCTKI